MDDSLWDNLSDPASASGLIRDAAQSKRRTEDAYAAPAQQPMRAGLKPAQQKNPNADQKKHRRQMGRQATASTHASTTSPLDKESTMTAQPTEADLLTRLASATTLAEQVDLSGQIEALRAADRESRTAGLEMNWDDLGGATSLMQSRAAIYTPGLPVEASVHGHTDATDWISDLAPDTVDDTAMTASMRAQATRWYTAEVWEPVKADAHEFSVQAYNAGVRASAGMGMKTAAAQSVFAAQVSHLASRDGITLHSAWGEDYFEADQGNTDNPTYVSDGRDSLPVGVDPSKAKTFDDLPSGRSNGSGDPKTTPGAGEAKSTQEGDQPESGKTEPSENPLTGDTSLDKSGWDKGEPTDRMSTQGGYVPEGKTACPNHEGQWYDKSTGDCSCGSNHHRWANSNNPGGQKSSSLHTAAPTCSCAHNSDGSVTKMLCSQHAPEDPCATMAAVTGGRRRGSIRNGTCTNCGWSSKAKTSAQNPLGPQQTHAPYCPAPSGAGKCTCGTDFRSQGSAHTAVSVSNVGVDKDGNGTGTTSDGTKIKFRLTDKERSDLKAVLYGDLAGNLSGVDIEPGDIISEQGGGNSMTGDNSRGGSPKSGAYGGGSPKHGDTATCHKDGGAIQFFDGQWMHLKGTGSSHNDVYPATPREQAEKKKSSLSTTADNRVTVTPVDASKVPFSPGSKCVPGCSGEVAFVITPDDHSDEVYACRSHVGDMAGNLAKKGQREASLFEATASLFGPNASEGIQTHAGNPHPVGTPAWFDWEHGGGDPASHGPHGSGAPGGGIPLHGPLSPEQEAWMNRGRNSRRMTEEEREEAQAQYDEENPDLETQVSRRRADLHTADAVPSNQGLGTGIDEGDQPEGGHSESPVQENGQGAADKSTRTDSDRPGGGVNWTASISENARVFVATLSRMASLDETFSGVPGRQVAALLAQEPGVPAHVVEALKAGGNPFAREAAGYNDWKPAPDPRSDDAPRRSGKCGQCGSRIERDPKGEANRGWHHADGSKHDHEAVYSHGDPDYDNTRSSSRRIASRKVTASGPVKGLVIEPDKTVREVTFSGLKDMQTAVQGLIEPVDLSDGVTMYVNEEGAYQFDASQVNWMACDVAGLGGRQEFMFRNPIKGPVILVGHDANSGESVDLPDKGRRWVKRVGNEAGAKWASLQTEAVTETITKGGPYCTKCGESLGKSNGQWVTDAPAGSERPFTPNCPKGGVHTVPKEGSLQVEAEGAKSFVHDYKPGSNCPYCGADSAKVKQTAKAGTPLSGVDRYTCGECRGGMSDMRSYTGSLHTQAGPFGLDFRHSTDCPTCKGTGMTNGVECKSCFGTGKASGPGSVTSLKVDLSTIAARLR